MNADYSLERDRQMSLLRNQVAQLISRNLELQQRIEELEREKAEVAVETIAAALVQSVHTTEQVIAAESPSQPYVVSQLQATLRGLINVQGDNLVLSLPHAEHPTDPNQLSSIQITVAQIPSTPVLDGAQALQQALENAQAAFSIWNQQVGVAEAQHITAQLTHLLAIRQQWGGEEFVRSAQALGEAAVKFADTLPQQILPELIKNYRAAAQGLHDGIQPMIRAPRNATGNLVQLARAIEQLTQSYMAIFQSKGTS